MRSGAGGGRSANAYSGPLGVAVNGTGSGLGVKGPTTLGLGTDAVMGGGGGRGMDMSPGKKAIFGSD